MLFRNYGNEYLKTYLNSIIDPTVTYTGRTLANIALPGYGGKTSTYWNGVSWSFGNYSDWKVVGQNSTVFCEYVYIKDALNILLRPYVQ